MVGQSSKRKQAEGKESKLNQPHSELPRQASRHSSGELAKNWNDKDIHEELSKLKLGTPKRNFFIRTIY